jgi:hypothetical protein
MMRLPAAWLVLYAYIESARAGDRARARALESRYRAHPPRAAPYICIWLVCLLLTLTRRMLAARRRRTPRVKCLLVLMQGPAQSSLSQRVQLPNGNAYLIQSTTRRHSKTKPEPKLWCLCRAERLRAPTKSTKEIRAQSRSRTPSTKDVPAAVASDGRFGAKAARGGRRAPAGHEQSGDRENSARHNGHSAACGLLYENRCRAAKTGRGRCTLYGVVHKVRARSAGCSHSHF